MTKITVTCPTFKRPEMLALALKNLAIAQHRTAAATKIELDVRIFLDHCWHPERLDDVEYVRDNFYPDATIFHAQSHVLLPGGCWNILESLKHGYEKTDSPLIVLLEEDVVPAPTFLDWCLEAHSDPSVFVSCGRLIPRYGDQYMTNPGTCYKRESLALLVPHIGPSFYGGRREYLEETFEDMPDGSDLDDGLIRRVIKKHNGMIAFPETPKCAHIGFKFYNACDRFLNPGTIEERIAGLETMLTRIPELDPTGKYSRDLEYLP